MKTFMDSNIYHDDARFSTSIIMSIIQLVNYVLVQPFYEILSNSILKTGDLSITNLTIYSLFALVVILSCLE